MVERARVRARACGREGEVEGMRLRGRRHAVERVRARTRACGLEGKCMRSRGRGRVHAVERERVRAITRSQEGVDEGEGMRSRGRGGGQVLTDCGWFGECDCEASKQISDVVVRIPPPRLNN